MWAVRAVHNGTSSEQLPVVTAQGLARLLATSRSMVLKDAAVGLMEGVVEEAIRSKGKPTRIKREGDTVWGVQPVRARLRSYNLSIRELVNLLNGVPGLVPGSITQSTAAAVMQGRQLPSPDFLARCEHVFQCNGSELFTKESMAAYTKKYGSAQPQPQPQRVLREPLRWDLVKASLPSEVSVQAAPLPAPVVSEEEDEEDMTSDAYWEKQEALANAAFSEAAGLPAPVSSSVYESLIAQSQQEAADSQFDPED